MIQMGRPDLVDFINPPMTSKVSGLKDYRFELVVENEDSNFFSEKPIDSMLCGCIPIYWTQRTPSYLNCFDMNGIVLFQTPEELYQKLCDGVFNEEFYQDRLQAVKYNFEKAKDYVSFGDVLWNAGLDNFLKKQQNMIDYNVMNPEPDEVLNGDIVHDFVEYSGIPFKEVKARIQDFQKINTEDYTQ